MYELTNEAVVSQDLATVQRQLLESEEVIRGLRNTLEVASQGIESWAKRFNRIKSALAEFAEEGAIEEGNALDDFLIEEFEIELYESMDVAVTVTYAGTITVPKGASIDEIDTDYNFPWTLQMRHGGTVLEDQEVTYSDIEIQQD